MNSICIAILLLDELLIFNSFYIAGSNTTLLKFARNMMPQIWQIGNDLLIKSVQQR